VEKTFTKEAFKKNLLGRASLWFVHVFYSGNFISGILVTNDLYNPVTTFCNSNIGLLFFNIHATMVSLVTNPFDIFQIYDLQ